MPITSRCDDMREMLAGNTAAALNSTAHTAQRSNTPVEHKVQGSSKEMRSKRQ
jgi:hypothetical protein